MTPAQRMALRGALELMTLRLQITVEEAFAAGEDVDLAAATADLLLRAAMTGSHAARCVPAGMVEGADAQASGHAGRVINQLAHLSVAACCASMALGQVEVTQEALDRAAAELRALRPEQ